MSCIREKQCHVLRCHGGCRPVAWQGKAGKGGRELEAGHGNPGSMPPLRLHTDGLIKTHGKMALRKTGGHIRGVAAPSPDWIGRRCSFRKVDSNQTSRTSSAWGTCNLLSLSLPTPLLTESDSFLRFVLPSLFSWVDRHRRAPSSLRSRLRPLTFLFFCASTPALRFSDPRSLFPRGFFSV